MRRVVQSLILCAWAAPCLAADAAPESKEGADAPVARLANHWEIGPIAGAEQFPVALGGYCVVALRDRREWLPGRNGEAARFDGLEYRFDSARDRQIFSAARESYVPMLGGDCPVTFARSKKRVAGKLEYGILHERRLIFFAGAEEQRAFEADPTQYENVDLVLDGRSVVSMIDDKRWVAGLPGTVVIHRGLRYFFANDYQRRIFLKAPGRYDGTGESVEQPNQLMASAARPFGFQQAATPPRTQFSTIAPAPRAAALGTLPAMSGYCPVSFRQDGRWVRGRREYSVAFNDIVFLTAGARERDLLKSDPTVYLPAVGGECAVSLVEQNEHVRGSVFHGAQFDDRLFLFADADAKAKFKANPTKYAFVDVAAHGNCVVTLVDREAEVRGLAQFAAWRNGKVYRFAGAAEKATFMAHPERYEEDAE